jgi:hypothetical protein
VSCVPPCDAAFVPLLSDWNAVWYCIRTTAVCLIGIQCGTAFVLLLSDWNPVECDTAFVLLLSDWNAVWYCIRTTAVYSVVLHSYY